MEGNKLMLGDYVRLNVNNKAARVLSISDSDERGHHFFDLVTTDGYIYRRIADHAISPILLGDVTISNATRHGNAYFLGGIVVQPADTDNCYWRVLSEGAATTNRLDGIRYLHELQHAIRLFGGEKEVEL
ncbi:MAG: hypothetical protein IJR13_07630 [Bacteroidales bacterium]|nr:hypothetical protein [Bacteroidales bacterium]